MNDLIYKGVEFPASKKDFSKTEMKKKNCIKVFHKNKLTYPIHISDEKIENSMDFCLYLMEINHIICTSKILTDLCLVKLKAKTKNIFLKVVYSVLVVKTY